MTCLPLPRRSGRFLIGLAFACLWFLTGQIALARVYIDIDSPAMRQYPLAVADFKPLKGHPGPGEDLTTWFSDNLGRYLKITGYFNVIERRAFLEDPLRAGITIEGIRFADWTAIGAEYLVKGGYAYQGSDLVLECRLFDVVKGELIVGKRYSGKAADRNDMIVKFAGEILLALTGEAGVFDTKIALVLKQGQVSELYSVWFDGSGMTRLTGHNGLIMAPRWSPDGRWIAFTSYRDRNPDGYLVNPAHPGAVKKIAAHAGTNLTGSWSPDGRRLLMTLTKDGNPEIYSLDVESGRIERLTTNPAIDVSPAWSPDGRTIAFVSDRAGSKQIYLMDADGNNIRRLTQEGRYNAAPSWSPRGRRIAFEGMAGGNFQIFTIDEDGGGLNQLTADGASNESPSWSPDGRYIAFSAKRQDKGRVVVMSANGSHVRTLYEGRESGLSPSWSPRLK